MSLVSSANNNSTNSSSSNGGGNGNGNGVIGPSPPSSSSSRNVPNGSRSFSRARKDGRFNRVYEKQQQATNDGSNNGSLVMKTAPAANPSHFTTYERWGVLGNPANESGSEKTDRNDGSNNDSRRKGNEKKSREGWRSAAARMEEAEEEEERNQKNSSRPVFFRRSNSGGRFLGENEDNDEEEEDGDEDTRTSPFDNLNSDLPERQREVSSTRESAMRKMDGNFEAQQNQRQQRSNSTDSNSSNNNNNGRVGGGNNGGGARASTARTPRQDSFSSNNANSPNSNYSPSASSARVSLDSANGGYPSCAAGGGGGATPRMTEKYSLSTNFGPLRTEEDKNSNDLISRKPTTEPPPPSSSSQPHNHHNNHHLPGADNVGMGGNAGLLFSSASDLPENPRLGTLVFTSQFECGNLGSARHIGDSVYDILLRPDTNNAKHRVWFYFGVYNHRRGQSAVFNILNFSKTKSLYRNGMTPFVLTQNRGVWERLPQRTCFYYRSPRHDMRYVLSITYNFETEGDIHYFCYSIPYTYTQLQSFLYFLELRDFSFLRRVTIGRTLQHRKIDCLRLSNPGPTLGGGKKKVVFITARVHPGESPSSLVMHGVIDFLTSNDPCADLLRKFVDFRLVPMLNPDGVYLGNYRCNSLGHDLNRQWGRACEWDCPELTAVKRELDLVNSMPDRELAMFIDLHAHSTNLNAFCFANLPIHTGGAGSEPPMHDPKAVEKEAMFLKLLDNASREFSLSSSRFCMDPSKSGTGRRALHDLLSARGAVCYTLEVSFFAFQAYGTQPIPFCQQSYIDLGKTIARTFVEYFRLPRLLTRKGEGEGVILEISKFDSVKILI